MGSIVRRVVIPRDSCGYKTNVQYCFPIGAATIDSTRCATLCSTRCSDSNATNDTLRPGQPMPFSDIQSEYLIGLSFRITMIANLATNQTARVNSVQVPYQF